MTHLGTSEFPFVRYRTGDIATVSEKECACGRGLPILESIEGRSTDFIVAHNGTIMHGLSLIYILRDMESIDTFKIVQESTEHTHVQIVLKQGKLDHKTENVIIDGFKARLGVKVKVTVEQLKLIEPEKSGKYRYVISKVKTS